MQALMAFRERLAAMLPRCPHPLWKASRGRARSLGKSPGIMTTISPIKRERIL